MPPSPILAAGAVVIRKGEVLLVHRPRYDDWSFPKGKLDRGEHLTSCAVREVREETGLDIHLARPLPQQEYLVGKREKVVSYWVGRVVGDADVSGYEPNDEIDQVAWVSLDRAGTLLTHPHDRGTLADAVTVRGAGGGRTRTLVVLRHAVARSRSGWRTDDRFRTLVMSGERQAARIAPVLAAYDVRRLTSSSSTRCIATLLPYADLTQRHIATADELSEEGATPDRVARIVQRLLSERQPTVLCTHRPVLPLVFAHLGLTDPGLERGELVVVHHRDGRVLDIETHLP
ncbi:NUDIX hydrolase [Nocardioides alcanivorans]|uniref:NUDIX hydrolase n=1 Tax=Nocardioides alcanivorans TaxID=2897352 RepID=UPI001F3C31F0|nr:NUDIX hydrolase [Nocardioides alcanivorans]